MTRPRSGDPAVVLLDPSSFTPHYDAKLAGALAHAGWSVEWITSRWEFEDVPAPEGVAVRHAFFAALRRAPLARLVDGPRRARLRRVLRPR